MFFSPLLALFISRAVALDFSSSYWIWYENATTEPTNATGNFSYNLNSVRPGGYPISAEIIIAGDNSYSLSVNGNGVGNGDDWEIAQEYCVSLNPASNVFTAQVVNGPGGDPNPAALLAAIEIFYSDGTTETIVSDNSWLAMNEAGGSWNLAYELGAANAPPWHIPTLPPPSPPLSLTNSQWIWTNEPVGGPEGIKPAGSRTFGKDITIPVPVTNGMITISTDNEYALYINDHYIGSNTGWPAAQTYPFELNNPTGHIIVAINATNFDSQAGVIAALELNAGCLTSSYVTDNTWKYNLDVPPGFPIINTTSWPYAVNEGLYPVAPWGNITISAPVPTITISAPVTTITTIPISKSSNYALGLLPSLSAFVPLTLALLTMYVFDLMSRLL